MSALGGIPGFTYPSLAYQDTQFSSITLPTSTFGGAGQFLLTVIKASDGQAVYVREVSCTVSTSGNVSTRTVTLQLLNGDGIKVADYISNLTIPANSTFLYMWSDKFTTAYNQSNQGYTPMSSIILVPGWSWRIQIGQPTTGDNIQATSAQGVTIPTAQDGQYTAPAVVSPNFA